MSILERMRWGGAGGDYGPDFLQPHCGHPMACPRGATSCPGSESEAPEGTVTSKAMRSSSTMLDESSCSTPIAEMGKYLCSFCREKGAQWGTAPPRQVQLLPFLGAAREQQPLQPPGSGAQPSPKSGWCHLGLLGYAEMILARNKIFLVGNRQGTAWEKVLASIKSGPRGCSQLSCTKVLGNLI